MSAQPKSRSSRGKSGTSPKPATAKASSGLDQVHIPRTAKGRRPYFFDDPNVDKLLAMITALAGEVSVLRERLDTHERLAAQKTWASETNVETYDAPGDVGKSREEWRGQFISRILRIVSEDAERMSSEESEREYRSQVRHVSS
jgi:hypothetical protein